MKVLETDRLVLRRLDVDDATFILELLNDPSFIRFIGDKGVRSLDDAGNYILNGPVPSYERRIINVEPAQHEAICFQHVHRRRILSR